MMESSSFADALDFYGAVIFPGGETESGREVPPGRGGSVCSAPPGEVSLIFNSVDGSKPRGRVGVASDEGSQPITML